MSRWRWLRRLLGRGDEVEETEATPAGPVRLPSEPFVFECRQCGKVFEARRMHPACPECDGVDVDQLG